MSKNLFRIVLPLLLILSLTACRSDQSMSASADGLTESEPLSSALLAETEDRGQDYLDRFIFFGESTTYHLKSRGVLSGGTETRQVWAPDGGTVNLDATTPTLRLRFPDTGEYLTVAEAAARKRPDYLVLTFGLNGAPANVRRGADYYKSCYRGLIDAIRAASPETKIILQSAFPVASNMDMSRYTVTLDELNDQIRTLNGWTLELAEELGLRYLNTAELLTNSAGRLYDRYQAGDGHHLTREAYLEILHYIRTHGYQ